MKILVTCKFYYIYDPYFDCMAYCMAKNFDEWAYEKIWRKIFDEFHKINTHIY